MATIECKKEKNTGELIGGNPGTDKSTITFEECSVEGKTVAECGAGKEGKIGPFEVKTVLGYPEGKTEKTEEAYDQFFPATSETVFVTFELSGTKCGLLNKQKVEVVATGTKVTEPKLEAKCGIIAITGKFTGETFSKTISGEESEVGGLEFPTTGDHERGSVDRIQIQQSHVRLGSEKPDQRKSRTDRQGEGGTRTERRLRLGSVSAGSVENRGVEPQQRWAAPLPAKQPCAKAVSETAWKGGKMAQAGGILIAIVWLAVTTTVLGMCRVAASGDAAACMHASGRTTTHASTLGLGLGGCGGRSHR